MGDLVGSWSREQWAEFWEEHDLAFLRLPAFRELSARLLEAVVEQTSGPDLDYSVDSLRPLGHWYLGLAREDFTAEELLDRLEWPWSPKHIDRPPGYRKYPERKLSKTLSAIYSGLGNYCDEVARRLIPESRYVCWRGGYADDMRNGLPVLDVGRPTRPFSPGAGLFGVAMRAYMSYFDPDSQSYSPPQPEEMADWVEQGLEERRVWVEEHGSPVWQVAPTGPKAFEGRKPMRRVSVQWMDRYSRGEVGIPTVYRGPEPPEDPDPQVGMG